jgi:glucokinase
VPIGFDLGGTKLLMVADGPAGRVVERLATGMAFDGRALNAAVESFLDAHRGAASTVGLAIPGLVGPGPFVQACDVLPGIVGWRPPASLTGRRFAMVNDAAAALAEECHDAPAGVTAAVVMVGTGIGAAMQVQGLPFGGANGWAG